MEPKLISIGDAARMMGVSVRTLQRWDISGKFSSIRRPGGHRYYYVSDIEKYLANVEVSKQDLFIRANNWASKGEASEELDSLFYCQTNAIFIAKLTSFQNKLAPMAEIADIFPLVVAMAGEIGDNSFAHNIGNWPDMPGIFFAYDVSKKELVLADRGRGILETLKRVRPGLNTSEEALRVAFTEIVSGRAPEERGNGLKFVRKIAVSSDINLYFKTGNAELTLKKGDTELNIKKTQNYIRGCLALISF